MRAPSGTVQALTILTPILRERPGDASHAIAIREVLASIPTDRGSPFARVPGTHSARFVVMDDVVYPGAPSRLDQLASPYLVFVADVDGAVDAYAASLATHAPDLVDAVFRHCRGYPGVADAARFAAYVGRCSLPSIRFFADVGDRTVDERLAALRTQARVTAFVAENQGRSAAAIQRAFLRHFGGETRRDEERPGPAAAPTRRERTGAS
jgi:hypothetical protein